MLNALIIVGNSERLDGSTHANTPICIPFFYVNVFSSFASTYLLRVRVLNWLSIVVVLQTPIETLNKLTESTKAGSSNHIQGKPQLKK